MGYYDMGTIDEVYKNSGLGKWFHKQSAGGEPGWDRYDSKGEKAGKCGDSKPGEPYAACLSKQKASKLGKKGVKSFVLRKRAKQREMGKGKKDIGGKGNKPINVKTGVTDKDPNKRGIQEMSKSFDDFRTELQEKNVPTNPTLWASVLATTRSKFDVYPSAYANAWAAKEYKKKGGGWRKSKGKVDEALIVALDEISLETKNRAYAKMRDRAYDTERKMKTSDDPYSGYDHRIASNRAKKTLRRIEDKHGSGEKWKTKKREDSRILRKRIDDNQKDYEANNKAAAEKAEQKRAAKAARERERRAARKAAKNEEFEQIIEKSAAWQRKEGKNQEGGLNAKGRASYERENPGSDLKAPVSAAQAKKSKGGKAAKRRKSFCARMGGMPGPMKDEKGRPTRKALALRKWDC